MLPLGSTASIMSCRSPSRSRLLCHNMQPSPSRRTQLNALLVAIGMASYLGGRAAASTRWYREKFGEKAVPMGKKHLVPFVF